MALAGEEGAGAWEIILKHVLHVKNSDFKTNTGQFSTLDLTEIFE